MATATAETPPVIDGKRPSGEFRVPETGRDTHWFCRELDGRWTLKAFRNEQWPFECIDGGKRWIAVDFEEKPTEAEKRLKHVNVSVDGLGVYCNERGATFDWRGWGPEQVLAIYEHFVAEWNAANDQKGDPDAPTV